MDDFLALVQVPPTSHSQETHCRLSRTWIAGWRAAGSPQTSRFLRHHWWRHLAFWGGQPSCGWADVG